MPDNALLLVGQPVSDGDRALIRSHLQPSWTVRFIDEVAPGELQELLPKVHAVLGSRVPGAVLAGADSLALIQTLGTGVDALPAEELDRRGVVVMNTHAHSPWVAEHGLSLLLALARRLHVHDALARRGERWTPGTTADDAPFLSRSVVGRTVGFVGFGHIGRSAARLLKGFDVTCLATTRSQSPQADGADRVPRVPLAELVARSEVVFVSVPLTAETRGLIDGELLAGARRGALWVHLSRWPVVDGEAMVEGLRSGAVGGLAVDHWFPAADPTGAALRELPQVLLSPYRATYLDEGRPHLDDALRQLEAYARDGSLAGRVDLRSGSRM